MNAVEREKILRYYSSSGEEGLAAKLLELAEKAEKQGRFTLSEFLDPYGLSIAETVAAYFPQVHVNSNGGYANAERVRVAFVADDFMGEPDYKLTAVAVKWDKRYYQLSHRDVLGAVMGLGCKRELFGDILLVEDGCQVIIDKPSLPYFLNNLTMIGAAQVTTAEIPVESLQAKEERIKEIRATVAALRLDAVAASGYGVSRSKMADEIKGQGVKLNFREVKNAAQTVKEGDVISFRGRGRVEVAAVNGTTKKGRTSILLRRYL